jgi:hypothetical protein
MTVYPMTVTWLTLIDITFQEHKDELSGCRHVKHSVLSDCLNGNIYNISVLKVKVFMSVGNLQFWNTF